MTPFKALLRPSTRRRAAPPTPEETEQRALLLRLCSLLLQYPDHELVTARPVLTASVEALPPSSAAGHLTAFTDWFTRRAS
ncbi:hypothetical protein ACIQCD_17700 [Streptomyces sp. NPDC093250]|uniref:hypothetical protein n=1 Tax=Streptomyces sp. NPDC093250 TaxID=3366036 RepID=UPI00380BBFA6